MDKKSLGNLGESAVERYLTEHGCFIVEKNYHATQGYRDEIDLIACDGSCILFVEVKTRRESANKPADFSAPFAVTAQKRNGLSAAPGCFCSITAVTRATSRGLMLPVYRRRGKR